MSDLSEQAQPVVENLLQSDVDQLYVELGMRAKTVITNPAIAGQFDPPVEHDVAIMGPSDDLKQFGQRLFQRWNREANELMCGKNDDNVKEREELVNAIGFGEVAVAASLAGLLVSSFGLAPAIATVVAAVVVKRFFRPAYEEFCEVWKESFEE